jgi:hypothetical protein
MKALVRWSAFCVVTGREMRIDLDPREYFAIGDREDLSYDDKLREYRRLADAYFELDRYQEFVAQSLGDLDAIALEYFDGPDFDRLLVETVQSTFPVHEHEHFVAHYRGLVGAWVADQQAVR